MDGQMYRQWYTSAYININLLGLPLLWVELSPALMPVHQQILQPLKKYVYITDKNFSKKTSKQNSTSKNVHNI